MTFWIVDYDLPADNRRRKFYRHIHAWFKEKGYDPETRWSTQRVVITEDREFAEFVYREASQLGHANVYKAKQVKGNSHRR